MSADDTKIKERASVMFGRPSSRQKKNAPAASSQSSGGGIFGGIRACFDGCLVSLLGFPTTNPDGGTATYPAPVPLEPMRLCTSWAKLPEERKASVKVVEVCSAGKECSPGWINQDATAACGGEQAGDDPALFFCVFDGHGRAGHEVARIAAERLPAHLVAHAGGPLSDPRKAIQAAFKKTDDDIYKTMGPQVEYSGSTGVAVLLDPVKRSLHVGNVGDSRCVLGQYCDGRWFAVPLTSDLKPDLPEEKQRIELSGGVVMALEGDDGHDVGPARVWESPARERPGLAVSRSLGDGASRLLGVIAEPVVTVRELQPNDRFLLLATDGLWDSLGNDQAVQLAGRYLDRGLPQVAVKAMTEAVRREEGGQLVDDTTMVLVVFS